MQVMVARFVILLVSSILIRSPTSNYVNSITCDGVLSLASNFSSCCFRRLVCYIVGSICRYDSRAVGGGSYAIF